MTLSFDETRHMSGEDKATYELLQDERAAAEAAGRAAQLDQANAAVLLATSAERAQRAEADPAFGLPEGPRRRRAREQAEKEGYAAGVEAGRREAAEAARDRQRAAEELQRAQEAHRTAKAEGHAEGRQEGYEAGLAAGRAELAPLVARATDERRAAAAARESLAREVARLGAMPPDVDRWLDTRMKHGSSIRDSFERATGMNRKARDARFARLVAEYDEGVGRDDGDQLGG